MLRQGLRFLVVGGFNTVFTYAIYWVLVYWWHPQIAWTCVFLIGLALGYFGHTRLVFRGSLGARKAVAYSLLQVLMYGLSSGVIFTATTVLDFGPRVAGAIAILINMPISFMVARRILSDRPTTRAQTPTR